MNRQHHLLSKARVGLLALAALGVFSSAADAAGIGFRNDLNIPIFIQCETVVNGALQRNQLLIHPRKVAWDTNLRPCERRILIVDANQTARVLGRFVLRFEGHDLPFAVVPVRVPPGAPPQVNLVPLPPLP